MSDIAERLRGYNPPDRVDQWSPVCGATLLSIARDIHDGADEIERLRAQVARLTAENDWLRAYTGQSAKACVYCGLGADEQGKCERGFPGCARADDQMLCREVGVALERDELRAEVVSLREQIAALESREVCTAAHENTETCGYCQRDALAQDAARLKRGLKFYADGYHFDHDGAFDTVSGEPQNFWCDDSGSTVEDGTVAKKYLDGWDVDDNDQWIVPPAIALVVVVK